MKKTTFYQIYVSKVDIKTHFAEVAEPTDLICKSKDVAEELCKKLNNQKIDRVYICKPLTYRVVTEKTLSTGDDLTL